MLREGNDWACQICKHNSVGNTSKLRIKNVNECVTASTMLYLLGGFGNVSLISNESNVFDWLSCR